MKILNKVIQWIIPVTLLFISIGASHLHGQVNLFTESFDEADGSASGVSAEGVAWNTDCSACTPVGYYQVMAGTFENHNTKAPGFWGTDDIDISECSRIELTIDYTGDPFPGSGNLESNDECNGNGPCNGDINMPDAGGCFNCWDFMDFKITIDGASTPLELIGTTNTPTSFLVEYDAEDCDGIGDLMSIEVTSQTWASSEYMRFDNVALVCYEDQGPSGTLTGGGTLCGEECTTADWEITGGTAPYISTFTFSFGGFEIDFPIPSGATSGTINICLDPSAPIPFFDATTNTLTLNENFGTTATIEMITVENDGGCETALTDQIINIELIDPPTITAIPAIDDNCILQGGSVTIDLSEYDDDIDGDGNTVTYYSDPALTNVIGPIFTTSTNTTIFAVVSSSVDCTSDDISIQIILTLSPELDPISLQEVCGEFIFPTITGTNLTGNAAYFSGPGGTGTSFAAGETSLNPGTYYVYDENNGCTAEQEFSVTLLPEPEIDSYVPVMVCGEYTLPAITGTNLSGLAVYHDLPGGIGNSYPPGTVITSSIALYAYDNLGPCSDEEVLTILVSAEPEIDLPPIISACGYVILPEISGDNISSNAMYYTGIQGGGASYEAGDTIFSSQLLFAYDAIGTCDNEVSININIAPGPILTTIPDVNGCDSYELPSDFDGQDLVNPTYFSGPDASGVTFAPGDIISSTTTIFVYDSVVGNGACFNQTSFLVEILEAPIAGEDVDANSCAASIIDLNALLDPSSQTGGNFIDVNNTGALVNDNTLDLNLSGDINFEIIYIVENICGIDTALLTIDVVDQTDAGLDQENNVCEGSLIDLTDYVAGDPGGSFYELGETTPITDDIMTDGMLGDIIEVIYVVGDGANCPADTSIYEFEITAQPEFITPFMVEACEFYELPIVQGSGLSGNELYYTENLGQGTEFEVGDSVFSSQKLYLYYNAGNCQAIDSFEVTVKQSTTELINQQMCPGQSLEVNGTTYDIDLQSGTQMLNNSAGCDSTIIINLSYLSVDTNYLSPTLCFGESIMINGETYDEFNMAGTEILSGMAMNGCDSIVVVDLTFSGAAVTPINEMICSGDSILINNIYYSETNPGGMDTIFMAGCDSILNISVGFFAINTGTVNPTMCSSESVVVNGNTYDIDNPTGTETLSGMGSNGCDSMVIIDLSFYNNPSSMLVGEFCSGQVIDTLGVSIDEDSPTTQVVLEGQAANGCDSIITILFTFSDVQEGLIMETVCEGGSITIDGTVYNEGNPSGTFMTTTEEGCDSLVNVMVLFSPVIADIGITDAECAGDGNGFIVFESFNITAIDQFYVLDGPGDQVPIELGDTIFNVSPGNHNIEFFTILGCTTNLDFTIESAEIPVVNLPSLVTIQEGGNYTLTTALDPTNTFLWTPNQDISCTDCSSPVFSPGVDRDYYLEMTSSAGCIVYDTISIRVVETDEIYIPNTFSPNNDGINDIFSVFSEKEGIYNLYIYDRWGNKIFEGQELVSNDRKGGWDGRFNGKTVNPGVFAYHVEFISIPQDPEDEEIIELFNGSITIIR